MFTKYHLMVGTIVVLLLPTISNSQATIDADVTEVNFAVFISASGPNDLYADTIYNAVELALDEINTNSNGQYFFNMTIYNPNGVGGPTGAMEQAINDQMSFIIGPISSAQTLEIAQLGVNNQTPIISYGASYPEVAEFDDHFEPGDNGYLWRTSFNHKNLGTVVGQFINAQNIGKIGLLSIPTNQILIDAYEDITVAMTNQLSTQELVNITVEYTDIEFGLDTILDEGPDVLYLLMQENILTTTLNSIQDRENITPIIADASGIDLNNFFKSDMLNSNAADGVFFIGAESIHQSETAHIYYTKYDETYGYADPNAAYFAARAYDATFAATSAIMNTGSASGPDIIQGLANLNFEGATGTIAFNEFGDRKIDYFDFFVGGEHNWTIVGTYDSTGSEKLDTILVEDFLNGRGIDSDLSSSTNIPGSTVSAEPLTLPLRFEYIFLAILILPIIKRKMYR